MRHGELTEHPYISLIAPEDLMLRDVLIRKKRPVSVLPLPTCSPL